MFLSNHQQKKTIQVGIAGVGAIGAAVYKAIDDGIDGFSIEAICDPSPRIEYQCDNVDMNTLIQRSDLIIEALPPIEAQKCAHKCIEANRDMIMISSCALLTAPDLLDKAQKSSSVIIVPSGALSGIDGVSSLKNLGIKSASIASTKKPLAYEGAPFITENSIDLHTITDKTQIFSGNAMEAATGFPANLNVAATLSLAGIGAENTRVEIWADPAISGNCHEVEVKGEYSTLYSRIENTPDPNNPKSSMLAAQSIVAVLRNMASPIVIL